MIFFRNLIHRRQIVPRITAQDIGYSNPGYPTVHTVKQGLDELFTLVGTGLTWKEPVATYNDLPTTGNSLSDARIVQDDGDGKSAMYVCVATSGTRAQQWTKIADVDWGTPTLDIAYDGAGAGLGRIITADSGAVEITSPAASGNGALVLNQNDASVAGLRINGVGGNDAIGDNWVLANDGTLALGATAVPANTNIYVEEATGSATMAFHANNAVGDARILFQSQSANKMAIGWDNSSDLARFGYGGVWSGSDIRINSSGEVGLGTNPVATQDLTAANWHIDTDGSFVLTNGTDNLYSLDNATATITIGAAGKTMFTLVNGGMYLNENQDSGEFAIKGDTSNSWIYFDPLNELSYIGLNNSLDAGITVGVIVGGFLWNSAHQPNSDFQLNGDTKTMFLMDAGNETINLGNTIALTGTIDDDTMATASATTLATSESIVAYVDAQIGANNELSEILANGNTTGGTDIAVSAGDDITFTDTSRSIYGTGGDGNVYVDSATDAFRIENVTLDKNIELIVNDGGVTKTPVTINASEGSVIFTDNANVVWLSDTSLAQFGGGRDVSMGFNGSHFLVNTTAVTATANFNLTTNLLVLNSTTGVDGIIDDDSMATATATDLATSESIVAYVNSGTATFTNKTFDANATGNSLSNVDVADLANGTAGELITWAAGGGPTVVAVGTATHILTSNGVGLPPTFQAPLTTGDNVYAYDTTAQPVDGANDWTITTFNNTSLNGWTYLAGQFTCATTGKYSITFDCTIQKGNGVGIEGEVVFVVNGTQVAGTQKGLEFASSGLPTPLSKTAILDITATDTLEVWFATTNASGTLVATGTGAAPAATDVSASISVIRIA